MRATTLHHTGPAGQSPHPRHRAPSSPGKLASCDAVWQDSSGTRSWEPAALRPKRKFHSPQRREGPFPDGPLPGAQQAGPPSLSPHSHPVLLLSGSFRSGFCDLEGLTVNGRMGGEFRFASSAAVGGTGCLWRMSTTDGLVPGPLTS